ncbi:MAG: methylenetetrahydrofolate reductase [Gammaproteobacteria bacterium]|nr:methylenetetrahydrofolate reductase [Gammaproteobacteria bacterium]
MTFKDALKTKDFVLTGHLSLVNVTDPEALIQQGETLRSAVDAVQLADNASMQPQLSSVSAAALLLRENIDPIVHFTCRDRNRIALQKDFFGAVALGVTSVMVMRGKKIPQNKSATVRNVYDTTAKELLDFINGLKNDDPPVIAPDFVAGTNAVIFEPDDNWSPENLNQKCDAGANIVQLQLCFDMDVLRNYMARIVSAKLTHRANFLAALSPIPSAEAARVMRDSIQGALVPDVIIERLESASDPEQEGIDICAELLQEVASIPGVSGTSLITLGQLGTITAAIEASGLRA